MRLNTKLSIMLLSSVFCVSAVQASGVQNNGVYASQYNPWRTQPQQWGYQNRSYNRATTGQEMGVRPQMLYSAPLNRIPARQFEYRRYIQQVNPYYSNQMPWWSDQTAVPYGPWAFGNNGSNGFW